MQAATSKTANRQTEERIWAWLAEVPDPEIPVLSVLDLGVVRGVTISDDGVEVSVSPTYSGCPATEVIERSIVAKLENKGVENVSLKRVLSPPWTTDWISQAGRDKLRDTDPDAFARCKRELLGDKRTVACPRCLSENTTKVSEFGSTPCKASYKCDECLEPFEYFKCI